MKGQLEARINQHRKLRNTQIIPIVFEMTERNLEFLHRCDYCSTSLDLVNLKRMIEEPQPALCR